MSEIAPSCLFVLLNGEPTDQMFGFLVPEIPSLSISGTKTDVALSMPVAHTYTAVIANQAKQWFQDKYIFIPNIYDFEIIAGTVEMPVILWNTFDHTISIEGITIGDATVELLTPLGGPFPLPTYIASWADVNFILRVTSVGPPVIDDEITIEFDGGVLRIKSVYGFRALLLEYLHNWESTFSINYEFSTVVSQNKKFYEQRRQQFTNMRRTVDIETWVQTQEQVARIKNIMQAGNGRMFCVCVMSEPITLNMTGSLNGILEYEANQDLQYLFNLNNLTNYLMVVHEADRKFKVVSIDEIVGNTITIEKALTEDINAEEVVIFPIMLSYIESHRIGQITNVLSAFSVRAKDLIYYG